MYWVAGAGLVATAAALFGLFWREVTNSQSRQHAALAAKRARFRESTLEIEDDTASRRKSKVAFGRR